MSDLTGAPDKRRRRTNAQLQQLERQIMQVLDADHPQSCRHVFYRMTNVRLPEPVEKSDNGYSQVQALMTKMRRAGILPYGWITDATRRGYHVDTFDSAADFIRSMAGLYRADAWRDSPHYVEVWCESRSIAGVIERDCNDLGVSLYPAGGFSSLTLAFQAAEQIKHQCADGKTCEIIYIGDYDPAGVLIDRSIEAELRLHLAGTVDLTFHRIGINPDQIIKYDLPAKPRKATDKRALHIAETVEAEAMPAALMRKLLREVVEKFMPQDALRIAKVAEDSEQRFLRAIANVYTDKTDGDE